MRYTIFILLLLINVTNQAAIRIIYTAALIPTHIEARKKEYIRSLKILKKFNIPIYIVEACKKNGPTFLENYCKNIFYAQSNNVFLKNKGVNEVSTLLEAINHFNFSDEDILIKLTGRYHFKSKLFINTIQDNSHYDAFVKLDPYGQVFTGCFAIKVKYLKKMLLQLDLVKLEKKMINIERAVADFLYENKISTLLVEKLDVMVRVYGTGYEYDKQVSFLM